MEERKIFTFILSGSFFLYTLSHLSKNECEEKEEEIKGEDKAEEIEQEDEEEERRRKLISGSL